MAPTTLPYGSVVLVGLGEDPDAEAVRQAADTLRGEFGTSIERNATHGSDAPETAAFAETVHEATVTLFDYTPRFVLGSLLAYLISQSFDVWVFHRIRDATGGRHLWLRNNGSTARPQDERSPCAFFSISSSIFPISSASARFKSLAEAQIQFVETHQNDFEDLDRRRLGRRLFGRRFLRLGHEGRRDRRDRQQEEDDSP